MRRSSTLKPSKKKGRKEGKKMQCPSIYQHAFVAMVVWTLALPSRSFVHGTTTTTTTTTVPAYSGSFNGEWEVAPEGSHYTKVEGSTNLYLYQIGGNKDTSSDDYGYYGLEDDDRSGGRPDVNWIITDQKLKRKREWIYTTDSRLFTGC